MLLTGTDINPSIKEDESKKEMEFKKRAMEESGSEESEEGDGTAALGPLQCSSIKIGSYTVVPQPNKPYVDVILNVHNLTFDAPLQSDPSKQVRIKLGSADILKMYVHFGRGLLVMFIDITQEFGELLRNALHMIENGTLNSDPSTKDDKTHLTLTFIIQCMTEDQMRFIRSKFPCKKCYNEIIEIDQKTANGILVNSTHNQVLEKLPDSFAVRVPDAPSEPMEQHHTGEDITRISEGKQHCSCVNPKT
ncbi:hypothetical protein JTE90_011052 [Oedothorax gibbosus]|uniref:Uncharacterized protein n=1 Tax=Oedothorax gibbosus TaxID=931172 RepID=A0AAV6VEM0_9ARAC|nr:hypothetical protein JTE90_011052 [Oedothorax gibbosus]